jgi:hypothetical protein
VTTRLPFILDAESIATTALLVPAPLVARPPLVAVPTSLAKSCSVRSMCIGGPDFKGPLRKIPLTLSDCHVLDASPVVVVFGTCATLPHA